MQRVLMLSLASLLVPATIGCGQVEFTNGGPGIAPEVAPPPPPPPAEGEGEGEGEIEPPDNCEPRAASPEELSAAFSTGLNDSFESCATCHNAGSASARDQAWGGRSDWSGAIATLAEAPAGGSSGETGEARLRGLYNDEITHPSHQGIADDDLDADMEALVDLAINGFVPDPNDPACQENPEPECRPANTAEITAAFTVGLNDSFESCATCHNAGSASARDQAWGGRSDWAGAISTLAEAAAGGSSGQTGEARLRGLYNDEITHPSHQGIADPTLDSDMEAMVTLVVDGVCD